MRIFVTGATGFVGTAVVRELRGAGHSVLGMARSDAGAAALAAQGVDVHRGELTDLDSLVAGAKACDGVAHLAFIHDFSRFMENIEIDRRAVEAMLDALEGSGRPFVLTSGIGMLAPGRLSTEDDEAAPQGRGLAEHLVKAAAGRGVRTSIVRLPPITHDVGDGGFLGPLIQAARSSGVSAYVGDGANRWTAGHRADAAAIYRLALEKGEPGGVYHAVAEEGLPTRRIAEAIGEGLGVAAVSVTPDQAVERLGFVGGFFALDLPASSALTRERLGWRPTHPGLLADIAAGFARALV